MIEVFKTNVSGAQSANILVEQIQFLFPQYKANFDLDDCDHILRIESRRDDIQPDVLIQFIKNFGFEASVLLDEVPESAVPSEHI